MPNGILSVLDSSIVPTTDADAPPSFDHADMDTGLEFYRKNGFALFRNLIPESVCANARQSFATQVKVFPGHLPRINGKKERNLINEYGFMVNPIMNAQLESPPKVRLYIENVMNIMTDSNLRDILKFFIGSPIGLFTWNQFEANPVTKPHHDCFFWAQDMLVNEVIGAWIALEDIHPGAGRLYVIPHSHHSLATNFLESFGLSAKNISPTNPDYQRALSNLIQNEGWDCTAPTLRAGDVLLWDSRTIHGSLNTTAPNCSRLSLTAHFSASPGRFIDRTSHPDDMNGVAISRPTPIVHRIFRKLVSAFDLK